MMEPLSIRAFLKALLSGIQMHVILWQQQCHVFTGDAAASISFTVYSNKTMNQSRRTDFPFIKKKKKKNKCKQINTSVHNPVTGLEWNSDGSVEVLCPMPRISALGLQKTRSPPCFSSSKSHQ